MKSLDASKDDNPERCGQRPSNSVMNNFGTHTSTDFDRRSSTQASLHCAVLDPSVHHHASCGPLSIVIIGHIHATITRPPAGANSPETSSPRFSPDTRRHVDKHCALDDMIDREAKSTTMQPATLQGRGDPEGSAVFSNCAVEAETSREQLRQESEHHTQAVTVRVSARRTKTTTRWSISMAGGRHRMSKVAEIQRPRGSVGLAVTLPSCPISNAAQNITFDMLELHFERPLHQAADSFCVCTTLLKKICRRNGINNWPYRKICGLRKSIASMAKQVNYLDGDQDALTRLNYYNSSTSYRHIYAQEAEPTEELFQKLNAEAAAAEQLMKKTIETNNEDEEKEAQIVPAWSTKLSLEPPRTQIVHELTIRPLTANGNTWGEKDFRLRELLPEKTPAFLIASTHHRALPSIASILQHQNYDSPSRAASTQRASTTAPDDRYYERDERQQPQWRYFPPSNDDAT